MDWKQVDVLHFIGLGVYLEAERFGVLLEKGCHFHSNKKGQIQIGAHGAYNQSDCNGGRLRRLELKT